jgi:hypothetical protein
LNFQVSLFNRVSPSASNPLTDSLVSSQVYEIIKTIYTTTASPIAPTQPNELISPTSAPSIDASPRIKVLQSTLGQLRLNNIATLDAITTHFTRLIDLTSADEEYVQDLAHSLAPCILRPRTESPLTLEDKHAYRLMRDLFEHKEAIFGELKRQSSNQVGGSGSQRSRNRAPSTNIDTDESSRREKFEARAKAINDARRERSPAPTNRHRRDKSTDGSGPGRFPVVASPRLDRGHDRTVSGVRPMKRESLEVPGSETSSPQTARISTSLGSTLTTESPATTTTNGPGESKGLPSPDFHMSAFGGPGPHIPPPRDDDSPVSDETPPTTAKPSYTAYTSQTQPSTQPSIQAYQPQSQTESSEPKSQTGSLKRAAVKPRGSGSLRGRSENKENEAVGVQLQDKAMDDFS